MAVFMALEDSPPFRKQIFSLEQTAEELRTRCQKLHKGCNRFMSSLEESYHNDIYFADSLEAFGVGQDDPVSVAIGGPVMSKFTTAFKELASFKELLQSQVDHMLSNRLSHFIDMDLQNVKECRWQYNKAMAGYDKAREKFVSIKKGTRADIIAELEENLHNSKSASERCRFNLVSALANVEAKKKFEFLESISAVMDAHMRYFKQGYELLSHMEPFIHQILTYTQQTKEMINAENEKLEKRIQEFRTQNELANLRSSSNVVATTSGDGIHVVGVKSYKNIEALINSTVNEEVQIIKQGYLLKRSLGSRGEWKQRFFVLNSRGILYYYGNKWSKQGNDNLNFHNVDLQTSTIKMDAEQTNMRFCFRIISPMKTFTLQAENEMERMDWVEKITGVIASLLNSPFPTQLSFGCLDMENQNSAGSNGADAKRLVECMNTKGFGNISKVLRDIPGNDACAECGAPEPQWASLNLGILVCIECSGVHRNLGVHISKVRSLTLDVKVWEPTIIDLFSALGNAYCNSVWEESLLTQNQRIDDHTIDVPCIKKPTSQDILLIKEKYIHSKYVDKSLIIKESIQSDPSFVNIQMWEAVKTKNVKMAYGLLVASNACANSYHDEVNNELHHTEDTPTHENNAIAGTKQLDPALCQKINESGEADSCFQGCSLLHLACHVGDPVMVELLLQFGADINFQDIHGRTPLHHCISLKNDSLAKYLIRRGAITSINDGGGVTALERAMELGAITDEELFILLAGR
ncbi:ADP-ribosylation factor GTPase-activating protein AGD2-like isoform X1 [Zingiber officinale]|uniref:ADP-ribosylation factor GTPase-activating protein AGD2-like isoform X1 n=2 Tax=Zingiber officinale TaxID=94328 RepID=UPI001C4A804D|nr:ADP-ribosylation factor GTPase-activating protein AGD2-like isoform X1 [Zingiber officinale]